MTTATKKRVPPLPGPTGLGSGTIRVACLTRISTDEANQPYSLEAQAVGLDAFVTSQPGYAITHRFVDQASGATLERPGLQAALSAARAGEFDVLLVYRIDRLARSITGLMEIVAELDRVGVALRSATEPIDTQGPVGRMLLQLLGIFAEFERGVLIDRITKGFERKAARGEWLSGRAPFGYSLESATKSLVPEPKEAEVVRMIFDLYANGHLGAKAIAVRLNEEGRRSRNHRFWSNQALLHLLRNPTYVGKIGHGGEVHDGKHEPIVDAAVFERAQALLKKRSATAPIVAPSLSEYTMTSATHCTECDGSYVGVGGMGNGRFYRYYICRHRHISGTLACSAMRVSADDLEREVFAHLLEHLRDHRMYTKAALEAIKEVIDERPRLVAELASVESELREANAAVDKWVRAFETDAMPAEECAPRLRELVPRRDELIAKRDQLETALNTATPRLPTEKELAAIRAVAEVIIDSGTPDQKKQLVAELVQVVDIMPNRHAKASFCLLDMNKPGPIVAEACKGTLFSIGSRNVEVSGLEPPTSTLRTWRSTS